MDRPARLKTLGNWKIRTASSRLIVRSWSSESIERKSRPFTTYGPYRPLSARISSPSFGSMPSTRGRVRSRSASSMVMCSRLMEAKRLVIRGFSIPGGGESGVPHWTYGP